MFRLSCAGLGLGAFFFSLSTIILLDDHFGRISPGRQIAQFGDLPFRDYLDPGYFLTEFSSAAVQWLFGDNLLGEALLTSSFIAVGTVLVFVLARRVSASSVTAFIAAVLALLLFPRAYDYDKVLFVPLGILLVWRYVETPTDSRVWAIAAGVVAGSLYRYDTGVFMAGSTVVAMAILHAGAWMTCARRLVLFAIAVGCFALPVLAYVQYSGGVVDALDQMLAYGRRETERTRLSIRPRIAITSLAGVVELPPPGNAILIRWAPQVDDAARVAAEARHGLLEAKLRGIAAERTWAYRISDSSTDNLRGLISDPLVEDTDGIDRAELTVPSEALWIRVQRAVPLLRVRLLPGSWNVANADAVLYNVFRLLPLVAALILVANLWQPPSMSRVEIASIVSVIALSLALNALILRDPVSARFGGMAAPTAILAAWTVRRVHLMRAGIGKRLLKAALVVVFAATVWSTSVSAEWSVRMPAEVFRPRHVISVAGGLRESPPRLDRLQKGEQLGIVRYLRECTGRSDRVLIGWFAPDLYFFAQRGFAAGAVAFFGQHWSEPRFQARSVQLLASESVPVVILLAGDKLFPRSYPLLMQYLDEHYESLGATNFDDARNGGGRYSLLVRRDRRADRVHPATGLPCF
jgi:hypothetical protein